ncbi:MAG: T9SS type A sorting domain-containing protein, partial [bacterium]|nr:T9SS type A sorting domain-containing protein [bacterium]
TGVLNGSPTGCQNETFEVSITVFDMEGSSDTLNTILNLIEHKMHFQFTDSTSDGCRIEINSVEIEGEQPEQCDEIGIFEITSAGDTVCIGASVLNGDFPLTVYAWKDDPNTGVVDGYTPGSDMIFRLYDSSTKIEYNTSAGYIQGDGTYSDGTHSIVSNLITTSKIGYVITGLTDETNEVIFTDNSLPVYLNLPDEIFLSINFLSGSLSGQTLSVTQLSSVSDELPEEQQFENPVSIFDISFDLEDFSASLTFRYSDSILNALGISEDDLAVSFYDSLDERGYIWHTVSYDIDEDENLIVLNTEHFSLWAITSNAESIITSVDEENPHNIPVPDTPELRQNYPNPFNPVTRIEYRLSRADRVTVTIYNVLGQEIARLVNSYQPAGLHTVRWDASGVASGTYLYRIVSGDFTAVKKMVVIK